jgi:serine/threonine-protein kinase
LTQQGGEIPPKIDRYEIVAPIGYGAMGAVYKAFDPIIKRPVAVKTIRLDVPPSSPDYRAFLERFTIEARTAGRLSHPNIVTLYDVGHTEEKIPWLAMEYVDGETVAELLHGEKLKPEVVISLVSQIAAAIDYAHGEGVVHRDIKPSNVIVYSGEKVKVTDFGIAKLMDADATHSGLMMGTPSYMSPEQAMGEDLDGSTDIFSLGVVAFEMLSGQQPFPGNNVTSILYKLVHSDPIHPDNLEVLGLLPDKWHEVFSRVLAKSPSERYPTAAAFVQNLELCLGSWFGALEGETVILREPVLAPAELARASSPDFDETISVPPPVTPRGVDSDETLVASGPLGPSGRSGTVSIETTTDTIPAAFRAPSSVTESDETIAAPAPDIERTLYAGPGVEPGASAAGDETVIEGPPKRPAMTVTIRKPRGLKPLLVTLAAGALLLAGFAVFLLTRRSEVPEPPTIEVAEEPAPPPSGSLRVTTQPDGARVLVNGEERGSSPLLLESLPLGTYQVRIESNGFEPEVLDASITAEAPAASLDVALRPQAPAAPAAPRPALFRIRSDPPGAQVAVDGKDVGVTPIERLQVDAGSRVVRVLQDGYLPWEDTFRARAGRTETIDAVLTARASEPEPEPEPEPEAPEPPRVVEGTLAERGEPGVTNPKCINCPGVPFPEAAKRSRLQGVVELSFLIDENGAVSELQVLESGGEVFDDAVLGTVKSWRYEPATKHGVRVKMRWVQRFRFQQGR